MPGAIPNLESWVRSLASTSSYVEHSWSDLEMGRWKAKNHGLNNNSVMRHPSGEEEVLPSVPKPSKEKKRKRVSPSDTPKPKKSKAHWSKKDTTVLPADVAQRLREEEEKNEDAGFELVARMKRSAEAPKAAEPVMNEEVHPWTEEISEDGPSKVPESSGAEDASRRDEQSADVPERADFEALQNEENAPSDLLREIDIGDSPPLPTFFEGQIQEAQAMGTPDVGTTHEGEDLSRGCFMRAEDATDLGDASSLFDKAQRILSWANLKRLTEEGNALKLLSGQKEEEVKELRAELATSHKEQTDLIDQVQQKAEKIEQLREEANMMKAETLGWKQNMDRLASKKDTARSQQSLAKRQLQSMKEESSARAKKIGEFEARLATELAKTTSEIHAGGFDLAVDIENAKVLKAKAKALLSSDDDDFGSASGFESIGDFDDEDAAPKEN
uniref:Uncharacterized protein n=1 Tax=Nicotiana tabacum TaxID=4097 RepID=A0A1S4DJF9_TOBAC|nr:PREDICTED: uncharacterized protein LOC107830462 [Nicotiana tabacum]